MCIGSTLSDFYLQEEGVPQGSVLSITLFSLKINNILYQLPHTVHVILYVDDLNIFCQEKDMRLIERLSGIGRFSRPYAILLLVNSKNLSR